MTFFLQAFVTLFVIIGPLTDNGVELLGSPVCCCPPSPSSR
jgi:hypothetical protein